ncbi:MAG: sulfotransferase [Pseudonocardiaceae bacterium]
MAAAAAHRPGPMLVTGLPRTGTSWVGKMLELSNAVVYVNEPLNPQHPPGHSPGVLDARVTHRFQYICADNEQDWLPAFRRTAALRYGLRAELRRNRSAYDLARMVKYLTAFRTGRAAGRRALFDDPFAVLSAAWFTERLDAAGVVLIRDPVALVGSWRRLGWTVYFHELLEQPLLMRDLLGPYDERMRALVGSEDDVAKIALLWCAVYDALGRLCAENPALHLVQYESLATDPVSQFQQLYAVFGLPWDERIRSALVAATTGTGDVTNSHRWTLRGGVSRTAYRPMDSKASLGSYRDRLTAEEIDRVQDLTADVATRLRLPDEAGAHE